MKINLKLAFICTLGVVIIILSIVLYFKNRSSNKIPKNFDKISPAIPTLWFKKPSNKNNVRCTMDVKRCPDGSYVGRVAPSCSFAPCP